ncbi:hypothetical protein G7054_g12493 [Neopestalotiopsis clavispora]|nr:hypothetical protein G7054_g12493 [Neopestalotiopsis clavispora]
MFKTSLPRHARLGNVSLQSSAAQQLSIARSPLRSACLQSIATRLYSSEAVAEKQQDDSSVGSQRITKFADLPQLGVHPSLVSAITEGMRYEDMTDVQSLTINSALRGVDLVAQAKTGTGKTLAFLVPVIQRLLAEHPELADRRSMRRASSDDVRAIIMSPTRELAEQIGVEARKLVRNTGIVVQTAVGGTKKRESLYKMQREGCHILVATPGRLEDLLSDEHAGVAAPNLKAFVLDEADRMLDVGFSDAIRTILDLLPPTTKVDRQTLLYSATIPRNVVHLAKSLVKTDNFEFVQTISSDDAPTHERVPQHIVPCVGYENWFPAILEIAEKAREAAKNDPEAPPFKAMVFFSNTATVEFAYSTFSNTKLGGMGGIPIWDIHSKLTQGQRTKHADSFRRTKTGILFSSDVTARGMDFPGVTHVIQVGLPPDRDQYIHRVGRTGRAGAAGEGWLLLAEPEISEARARLPGLPIKPNRSLVTATADVPSGKIPEEAAHFFEDIDKAYSRTRPREFSAVYHALLGQKFGRKLDVGDAVELLNRWSEFGLKRDQVPAISASSAKNRGLSRIPGVRIGNDREDDDFDRGHSFGGVGGGRGGGGYGNQSGFSSGRGGFSRGGDSRGGNFRGGNNNRRGNSFEDRFSSREDRGGRQSFGRSSF